MRTDDQPPWPPPDARLDELIDDATTDAYGESEQVTGLFTMIEQELDIPFETEVLGVRVVVEGVELTARDEIVALCRRGAHRQALPLLQLPLPSPPPAGAEWIEAYHRWAH